jgi:large subunit ribosomal protein L29
MENSVIKELSSEELNSRIIEEKHNMSKIKMAHAVSPIENPQTLKSKRKLIAKLLTEQVSRSSK